MEADEQNKELIKEQIRKETTESCDTATNEDQPQSSNAPSTPPTVNQKGKKFNKSELPGRILWNLYDL